MSWLPGSLGLEVMSKSRRRAIRKSRSRFREGSADWQKWDWLLQESYGRAVRCRQCDLHYLMDDLDEDYYCGFCRSLCIDLDGPARVKLCISDGEVAL